MGMVVQHNISAMNANEAMRKNVAGLKKQTEKLSTGYNINRAADNAAGLAISEKMRSQIRGLTQASANSNDAISLIQTAEGGLQETEDILQRMRELSVQSANGTYTDEDREQIQYEVDALKAEVDRISQATEYNEMKLLDGSLSGVGGKATEYGAKYGVIGNELTDDEATALATDHAAAITAVKGNTDAKAELGIDGTEDDATILKAIASAADTSKTAAVSDAAKKLVEATKAAGNGSSAGFHGSVLTANVQGASIAVSTNATKGGEGASWEQDGKTLTLNLVAGKTYTQDDIDKLIANADTKKADGVVADLSLKLKDGVYTATDGDVTAKSAAGVRAESSTVSLLKADASAEEKNLNDAIDTLLTGYDKGAAAGKAIAKAVGLKDDGSVEEADIRAALKKMTSEDMTATELATVKTKAEALETKTNSTAGLLTSATTGYGDQIKFTSNSYGVDSRTFSIATDAAAGKESVEATTDDTTGLKDGAYTIHLSTGVEYSNEDIEKLMAKAGLDYTVEISDSAKPDGDVKMKLDIAVSEAQAQKRSTQMDLGEGVGKEDVFATGEGLTFQIGANGVEDQRLTVNVDDMGSNALGIKDISVAKQDDANKAITKLDDAIKKVSTQRAKLGAVQNRLEHTVNSLNTANENLSASESQIRDTDMAAEMIKYTKSNILQQASQSMLAQANQQPQGVLQLLG